MSGKRFAVTPPGALAYWTLGALFAVPALVLALNWSSIAVPGGPWHAMRALALPALVVLAVFAWCVWALQRRFASLDADQLVVGAGMFTRRVPVAGIDPSQARIVDLAEHTELRPGLRAWGMALPGFKAGWYIGRDRARRFCMLTDTQRVLHLPVSDGKPLLLSLEQPQQLLDALARARR